MSPSPEPWTLADLRRHLDAGPTTVIVVDLDGVLRHFDEELWRRLDERLGAAPAAETSDSPSFRAILGSPFLRTVVTGGATRSQWCEQAVADLAALCGDADLARSIVDEWARTTAVPDQGLVDLLMDARGAGCEIFVFTNGTDEVPAELEDLGLDRLTAPDHSHLLNTYEFGEKKPAPEAYAHAHRRIEEVLHRSVPRSDVIFLDDRAANVAAAEGFGWHGRVWNSAAARV